MISQKVKAKRVLKASEQETKNLLQDQNIPSTGQDKTKPVLIYEVNFATEAKLV